MDIPKNHQSVMPYLILNDVRGFLLFVQNVFDAEILTEHLDQNNQIMHAEVQIGNSTIMMGQTNEIWSVSNSGLFVYVANADSVYQLAIQCGAETIMHLENKDYGRTCGVKDPFGNTWWITSL